VIALYEDLLGLRVGESESSKFLAECADGAPEPGIRDILPERAAGSSPGLLAGSDVEKAAQEVQQNLTTVEEELMQTKNEAHQEPSNLPPQIATLKRRLEEKLLRLDSVFDSEVAGFAELIRQKGGGVVVFEECEAHRLVSSRTEVYSLPGGFFPA